MGYTYQTEKLKSGTLYYLDIKRGTWTYVIDVSLSPSKTKLWFSGWLSKLPDDEKVPADKLLSLLEASWTNGPTHFRYHRPWTQLNMGVALDNKAVTAASFRSQMELFMDQMKNPEPLWNVKKWSQPAGPTPPPAPTAALEPASKDKPRAVSQSN